MKRINIIGQNYAIAFPSEGENWGLNYHFHQVYDAQKIDKLFVMDGLNGLSVVRGGTQTREEILERLNLKGYPVITPWYEEGVNNSEIYPLQEIQEKYQLLYFKSTIGFMLGYAALHNYDEVHFFGVYASGSIEYMIERPAIEYWMGVLRGQGAKMIFHNDDTRLLGGRPSFGGEFLYGYEMLGSDALEESNKQRKEHDKEGK